MAVLDIVKIGDPALRVRAREVGRDELLSAETQTFIDDLVETMRAANGAGLAATQLARPLRIAAVEVESNPRYPYKPRIPLTIVVNPVLTPLGDETFDNYEGCLSVPDLRGVAPRFCEVRLVAWDRHGEPIDRVVRGLASGTFQHEIDHLDGKVFLDRVRDTSTLTTWREFELHHRDAFVARAKEIVARFGA